jgi:hypothetical protein
VCIGIDCVISLVLQCIGLKFCSQSDASAFLGKIEEQSLSLCNDTLEGCVELSLAVTTLRAEDISSGAGRVEA